MTRFSSIISVHHYLSQKINKVARCFSGWAIFDLTQFGVRDINNRNEIMDYNNFQILLNEQGHLQLATFCAVLPFV